MPHRSLNARRRVAGELRQLANEFGRVSTGWICGATPDRYSSTARMLRRAANMIKREPGMGRRPAAERLELPFGGDEPEGREPPPEGRRK
jgi:hypothetical protein